ncbi:hypothetical protein M595_0626 [Lyngbya aestuarii BL J]|uniref:Uncharacterized protein n=2 Tax=Lyngbya aestuarii BL J TaxID=1348334 RepID=U7QMW6_9CYAN|nr:DUF99 family protein [Lyngbya aestuarii]ERT09324.1 hypothetical protein M595_0626 [Lyngbya aestuarii BL J]
MNLETLLKLNRVIRVIGFDDAPFERHSGEPVSIAGVVCGGTRFEGVVWGQVQPDGWDATDTLCHLLIGGKFLDQLHLVLIDGIGFGGFNLIDLPELASRLERPCVAVMRRPPNLSKIEQALRRLPDADKRLQILRRAGQIHAYPPFFFQVCGEEPLVIAHALERLTDCGKVPEALRLAHLIGAAVITGESGSQA